MASNRLPALLAVEIVAEWPTTPAGGTATVDRGPGCGESHVGRGTDCLGTAGEARDSGLATYGAAIHSADPGSKNGSGSQAWSSFMRTHARAVLACDFFVTV